jgi:hypothetical protein
LGWDQCPTAYVYVLWLLLLTLFRAKHLEEVKHAKSKAKKSNYLLSHSLSKEFKSAATLEEKRELINSTLTKLRGVGLKPTNTKVCFLIV